MDHYWILPANWPEHTDHDLDYLDELIGLAGEPETASGKGNLESLRRLRQRLVEDMEREGMEVIPIGDAMDTHPLPPE